MRMRRKKNLDERIKNSSDYLIIANTENLNYDVESTNDEIIDFKGIFGNDNPIWLEIGCGKGQFAVETAKLNPNINVIAVEKCSNVIVDACKKATEEKVQNIKFVKCGAEYLARFIEAHSVARIFLNFSCPYPKKSYTSHRLTNERFLKIYEKLLADGAEIHQKTDNMHFFEYSIEALSNYGFTIKNISLDLHNSDFEGNIVTEYEKRFSDQGFPIYRLEAFLKN